MLQDTGNTLFDKYLGIETAGLVEHDDLEFGSEVGSLYQASNWLNLVNLRRWFRQMDLSARDVFIDFGCGKGQVLALAARYPFGRVIGLDLSPTLLAVAASNMERIRSKSRCGAVELVNMNATEYPIPSDLNTCYFYMPFPTPVYEHVVSQLAESARICPRSIRIIYLNQGPDDVGVPARYGFRKVADRRLMTMYTNGLKDGYQPASQAVAR